MIRAILILAAAGLSTCTPETKEPDQPLIGQSFVDKQRAQCEARDGAFKRAGKANAFACFITPKDAGKACSKESD